MSKPTPTKKQKQTRAATDRTAVHGPEYVSNPFRVIFKGFSDAFNYNQTMSIIILVAGFAGLVFNMGDPIFNSASGPMPSGSIDPALALAIAIIVIGILLVVIPLAIVFGVLYGGSVALVALKTSQKETISFSDCLSAVFGKFWTLLWIQIVVFFKVLGGLLLFIVPGIRAAVRYNMVFMPVFADGADAKQAIAKTKDLSQGHLMEILGMSFAAAIIPFVSSVMDMGGKSVMYPQLTHLAATNQRGPKAHWLNYLVFIVIGGFVALGLLIALIILAAT